MTNARDPFSSKPFYLVVDDEREPVVPTIVTRDSTAPRKSFSQKRSQKHEKSMR